MPDFFTCGQTVWATRTLRLWVILLFLAGCASVPVPDRVMNQAQASLQAAEQAGAANYAPADLRLARDKFQQAQRALSEDDFTRAANFAAESMADAILARTRALLDMTQSQIHQAVQANTRLRLQNRQVKIENARHQRQQRAALMRMRRSAVSGYSNGIKPSISAPDDLDNMPVSPSTPSVNPFPGQGFQSLPVPAGNPSGHRPH